MDTSPTDRHLPPGARGLRLAPAPTISVVVASRHERHVLEACLEALLPQCRELGAEVVVARAGAASEVAELERAYPTVRFVVEPTNATIPELRATGMADADGDIVALTEDHCAVAPDWLKAIARESKRSEGAAKAVASTRERAIAWAEYFAGIRLLSGESGGPDSAVLQ